MAVGCKERVHSRPPCISSYTIGVFQKRTTALLLARPPQGDAFRMLQARLAPIPIMAMLALREPTPLQPSSGSLSAAGSAAALAQSPQPAGSPAGSPRGSGTWAGLDPAAASPEQEGALSPRQRSQAQRPRLMQLEEKRLVQLFKSRASRLG